MSLGGTIATAIDVSDSGITTGLALGASDITGSTADINFDNFNNILWQFIFKFNIGL